MEYGLIGERLGHSYSPELHRRFGNDRYELKELKPEEVAPFLRERSFRGINVTIPYKQTVIPCLDEISDRAGRLGAVNTIVNRDGRLIGDNTDYMGFRDLVLQSGVDVRGEKTLLLGTGGTCHTARVVMADLGAGPVLPVSRDPGRAGPGVISYDEAVSRHRDAGVLINTTPVGMFPKDGEAPLDLTPFSRVRLVLDVIYHPLRTNFVLQGKELGVPAFGGMYMLVSQGVYADALFFDHAPETDLTDRVCADICREKENLVLIGMPTSGKTVVGRDLAAKTGRRFLDTDEEFERRHGVSPADFIRSRGEPAFRDLESETVAALSRETGVVLSTGGGAVLRSENVLALKRNGRLFFLDRPPALLQPSADRPLSADADSLKKLYEVRYPVYLQAADHVIRADRPPEALADEILRLF